MCCCDSGLVNTFLIQKMSHQFKNKKGFTLIEILIVISIVTVLSTIIIGFFVDYRRSQGVAQDTELITSMLYRARNNAISSNGSSDYGVHFATSSVTIFKGSTYTPSNTTNQVFTLTIGNTLSTISLSSGGVDVVFNKLTGETTQTGTLTLTASYGVVKTITIYPTGLIQ